PRPNRQSRRILRSGRLSMNQSVDLGQSPLRNGKPRCGWDHISEFQGHVVPAYPTFPSREPRRNLRSANGV
ncbi:MAG: hypothetical protein WCI55_16310, partial [Armatimonadota bacterium]